ncbi:transposase [Azospirillum canadense]|nr:transposase [Azospirillum canadense]
MSLPTVHRWQRRVQEQGVDGLLRDKTRPSRIPVLAPDVVERVVEMTFHEPPGEATHWSSRTVAAASGVSVGSVQCIWRAHGL